MYSLDCDYYKKEFSTLDELLDDIILSGMDPNYLITYNGATFNYQAIELMTGRMSQHFPNVNITKEVMMVFCSWVKTRKN